MHIPFCLAKCDYCDFFSVSRNTVPDSYIDSLIEECSFYVRQYGLASWNTIYIGGGTPSLMGPGQLERLASGLKGLVYQGDDNPVLEFTMEMNPETVSQALLLSAERSGVTRLSLGVQSLTPGALSYVHRHCHVEQTLRALELVRQNWRGQLSLDCIAGLPGQTTEQLLDSLSLR